MSLKQKVRQLERKRNAKGKFIDLKELFGEDVDFGGRQFRTFVELITYLDETDDKLSKADMNDSKQDQHNS